jgi:predicted phosphodiesterase
MKIGILTDIHENTQMLQEALRLAEAKKCDELACLGDIVGFDRRFYKYIRGRSAKNCLGLIKSNCKWIVAGNHDLFAARRFPLYSNGFNYPDRWFTMSSEERKSVSAGKVWSYEFDDPNDLGEDDIAFIRSLPEFITTSFKGISSLLSHYIFPDFTGSTTQYIERNKQLNAVWDLMSNHQVMYSFSGHSHGCFAGFAYRNSSSLFKAINSIPTNCFSLGNEMIIIALPPLAGEKGKTGFSIIDTETMKLEIVSTIINQDCKMM